MRQRIAKYEQVMQNPSLGFFSALSVRVRLFLTYIQYAFVHSFTLLFLHPTKSFVALNDPASNGLWRRSYLEHLAYRNQVRFASLSGFFVLLTATVATFAIVITIFPDRGVTPVFAATLTVNSNDDVSDGSCDAVHCSLREAITQANLTVGPNTITFSGAPFTITPTTQLPSLTGNSNTIQGGGQITINGTSAGASTSGLDIQGDNNIVQGLIIHSFSASGISVAANADTTTIGGPNLSEGNVLYGNGENGVTINGGVGNTVVGNKIGQRADGSLAKNSLLGISVLGGSNTTIGGTSSTNYITDGISIGTNAATVTLYGNVVGMSSSGLTGALTGNAVAISGANTALGGTAAGQRNYLVAGGTHGVYVDQFASSTFILGNYVGIAADGTASGNAGQGISVYKSTGTTVSSNTVAGNTLNGIYFDTVSASINTISDNIVGVLPSGTAAANGSGGITSSNSSGLTISGNITGNNTGPGIDLTDTSATITGNYIGMDQSGMAMPNGTSGIALGGASAGSVVGGSVVERNFIGNNEATGIRLLSSVTGTPEISYNYIGVNLDGTAAGANVVGIRLDAPATVANNLVSGNLGNGIYIDSDGSTVTSNSIGLNAAGDAAVANGGAGIYIGTNRNTNTIGLTGQGNVIAGNIGVGLFVDSDGVANSIVGNYFSCNSACTTPITSDLTSMVISGSVNTAVSGNYFGGSGASATVQVISGATGTQLTGNFFGQGTDGSNIANEGEIGVLVQDSDSQTIGTIEAGNSIANFVTGIKVDNSNQVSIRGNTFSNNIENTLYINNANQDIEPPVVTEVTAAGAAGTSVVSGSIDLYEDGAYVASGESDGTWEIETTLDVDKTIAATITDSEGNTSDFGVFTPEGFDTTAPASSASPAGGIYSGTQSVTLSATDDTDSAPTIFFTTDGSTPTTGSTVYTTVITITADTTLQFFAVDASDNAEAVQTEVYDIQQDTGGIFGPEKISVKANGETIHPECNSCVIRIADSTPTFLGVVSKSLIDYIVRLVIFASTEQVDGSVALEQVFAESNSIIQNPKNSENAMWKISVPEEKALDLGEYVVKVGLRDPDGAVVKPMAKKVSLAVTPSNPVVVSPQALVYTETPSFIGNALNDMRVIARVFQDGEEVGHCQADVVNSDTGTGSYACSLPFELKVGQYTARVNTQDPVSELISEGSEVVFSVSDPTPATENVPFSLVSGEVSIQSQYLTTDNTPVFVGLATNDTEVVVVVDGTKLFSATLTNDDSGVGHWEATTSFLADGVHTAYAVVRAGGTELSRTETLQFRIVPPTVVPTISSPADDARIALGQQIIFTVLGHSGDTVELSLSGSTDITVASTFSGDSSGTGLAAFTFSHGLPRGTWVVTAVATDPSGKPSVPSESIALRVYVPVATVPTTPTNTNETPTNTNETPTNTNEEPVNTNEVPTNTNETPINTNEAPTNTNEVPANTNEIPTGNVNETPTETPAERQPLPEPPPAFTFPEAVENFPIIDKTPEDLTSEEVEAVRIVLNSYLRSELQILPVEQEGNALYLVMNKTADNEPIMTVAQEVGLETSSALTSTLNSVLRIFGFQQFKQTDSLLIFRGTTVPYATVTLTIFSDPIVKIAQADADGRWTMTVAADTLPPGEHSAYVQTAYGGAESEEVQIARFVVVQQEHLSNTTWLFIINLGVILIVLLAAIFLQLRKRTQLLEIKQASIPTESPWKSGSVKLPKKEETKKPKGPDDLGDIMGI